MNLVFRSFVCGISRQLALVHLAGTSPVDEGVMESSGFPYLWSLETALLLTLGQRVPNSFLEALSLPRLFSALPISVFYSRVLGYTCHLHGV